MEKILCVTDGSLCAMEAVGFAVRLSRKTHEPVTFLAILAPIVKGPHEQAFWNVLDLGNKSPIPVAALEVAARLAYEAGLTDFRCRTAEGMDVAQAIIDYARANHYTQVIAGSVGLSGLKRIIMGSVAEKLVRQAHCPVTVVRLQ